MVEVESVFDFDLPSEAAGVSIDLCLAHVSIGFRKLPIVE